MTNIYFSAMKQVLQVVFNNKLKSLSFLAALTSVDSCQFKMAARQNFFCLSISELSQIFGHEV